MITERKPKTARTRWPHRLLILFGIAMIASACGSDGVPADPGASGALPFADCVEPPSGMVRWWSFDESVEVVGPDGSGEVWYDRINNVMAYDGTQGATDIPGKVAGAVETKDAPLLTQTVAIGTSDFTIDAWVRGDNGGIFHQGDISVWVDDQQLMLTIAGEEFSIAEVTSEKWSFVTVHVNRAAQSALVTIDGFDVQVNLKLAVAPPVDLVGRDRAQIGSFMDVDELEIFDRYLSHGEILALFQAGADGKCKGDVPPGDCDAQPNAIAQADLPDDLVAWWPFDWAIKPGHEISQFADPGPFDWNVHPLEASVKVKAGDIVPGKVSNALDATDPGVYAIAPLKTNALDFGTSDFAIDLWAKWGNEDGTSSPTTSLAKAADEDGGLRLGQPATPLDAGLLEELVNPEGGRKAISVERLIALTDMGARRDAAAEKLGGGELPTVSAVAEDDIDGFVLVEHGFANPAGGGWVFYVNEQGRLSFAHSYINAGGDWESNVLQSSSNTTVFDGEWHLFALSVDVKLNGNPDDAVPGASTTFFFDGAPVGGGGLWEEAPGFTLTNDSSATIGALQGSNGAALEWPGMIDEVEIFNNEISEQFVKELFDAGSNGKCKPDEVLPTQYCKAQVVLNWDAVGYDGVNGADYDLLITVANSSSNENGSYDEGGWKAPVNGSAAWTNSGPQAGLNTGLQYIPLNNVSSSYEERVEWLSIPVGTTIEISVENDNNEQPEDWTLTGWAQVWQDPPAQMIKQDQVPANLTTGTALAKGDTASVYTLTCGDPKVDDPVDATVVCEATPTSAIVGQSVTFNLVVNPAAAFDSAVWTFTPGNGLSSGLTGTTTFTQSGNGTASVDVTMKDGSMVTTECNVEVAPAEDPDDRLVQVDCGAISPNPAVVGQPVTFTVDVQSNVAVNGIEWSFDPTGAQESGASVTTTFTQPGAGTGRVQVYLNDGTIETDNCTVEVVPSSDPCPDFSRDDVGTDPGGDWDGDGATNADEFENGTNPCDPESVPPVELEEITCAVVEGLFDQIEIDQWHTLVDETLYFGSNAPNVTWTATNLTDTSIPPATFTGNPPQFTFTSPGDWTVVASGTGYLPATCRIFIEG